MYELHQMHARERPLKFNVSACATHYSPNLHAYDLEFCSVIGVDWQLAFSGACRTDTLQSGDGANPAQERLRGGVWLMQGPVQPVS